MPIQRPRPHLFPITHRRSIEMQPLFCPNLSRSNSDISRTSPQTTLSPHHHVCDPATASYSQRLHNITQLLDDSIQRATKLGVPTLYVDKWVYCHEVPTKFLNATHLSPDNIAFLALPFETRDKHLRHESMFFLQSQQFALEEIKHYLNLMDKLRGSITS
jgi:hypothetical protein